MAKGPQLPDLSKLYQTFSKGVQNVVKAITPKGGVKAGLQRVGNLATNAPEKIILNPLTDPSKFTKFRSQAVPLSREIGRYAGGEQGANIGEGIGRILRGGLRVTPFQARPQVLFDFLSPGTFDEKTRKIEQSQNAKTGQEQLLEGIGELGVGTMSSMGLTRGGVIPSLLVRGGLGGTIGTAVAGLGALSQGRLPTGEELKTNIGAGVRNSWKFAWTDYATDTVLRGLSAGSGLPIFKKLTQDMVYAHGFDAAKNAAVNKLPITARALYLMKGLGLYLTRGVLESPAENLVFTAEDVFQNRDKRPFFEAYVNNMPNTIVGNLLWAGMMAGMNVPVKYDQSVSDIVKSTFANTLSTMGAKIGDIVETVRTSIKEKKYIPAATKIQSQAGFIDFEKFVPDQLKGTEVGDKMKTDAIKALGGEGEQVEVDTLKGRKLIQTSGTNNPIVKASEGVRYNATFQLEKALAYPKFLSKISDEEITSLMVKLNSVDVTGARDPVHAADILKQAVANDVLDMDVKDEVDATIDSWAALQVQHLKALIEDGIYKFSPEEQARIVNLPSTNKPQEASAMEERLKEKGIVKRGNAYVKADLVETKAEYKPDKIETVAVDKFGITQDANEAAYMTKNGLFLSGSSKPGSGQKDLIHGDIARQSFLEAGEKAPLYNEDAVAEYLKRTGNVRLNIFEDRIVIAQINQELSQPQLDAFEQMFKEGKHVSLDIRFPDGTERITNEFDDIGKLQSFVGNYFKQSGFANIPVKRAKTKPEGLKTAIEDIPTKELQKRVKTVSKFKPLYKAELENRIALGKQEAVKLKTESQKVRAQIKSNKEAVKIAQQVQKAVIVPAETKSPQKIKAEFKETKLNVSSGDQKIPTKLPKGDKRGKYIFNINTDKNALKDPPFTQQMIDFLRPQLEGELGLGKPMTDQEIVEFAQAHNSLAKILTRDERKGLIAGIVKARDVIIKAQRDQVVTEETLDAFRTGTTWFNFLGTAMSNLSRKQVELEGMPMSDYVRSQFLERAIKAGATNQQIIEASKGIDFSNAAEATKFYREIVKPTLREALDDYIYFGLLSSPTTHQKNALSNLLQSTILPVATKLHSGVIDYYLTKLTPGRERQQFVAEAPAYIRGFINSFPNIAKRWKGVFGEQLTVSPNTMEETKKIWEGTSYVERPDLRRIPTNLEDAEQKIMFFGKERPVPRAIRWTFVAGGKVTKLLEAGDIFFRTASKAGQLESLAERAALSGKDIPLAILDKKAHDLAQYGVFRQPIDEQGTRTGQGKILQTVDRLTSVMYTLRHKVPGVSWFVRFIMTPMAIFKQGAIELNPVLGPLTTIGMKDDGVFTKVDQYSKSLIGAEVLALTAFAGHMMNITFAPPRGEGERQKFYGDKRKPYSILVPGAGWVSYLMLGPFAYPMMIAAAWKHYNENSRTALTDNIFDKFGGTSLGLLRGFSDQTYAQGTSDMVDISQGEPNAWNQFFGNFGRQLVPFTSLLGWITRVMDPYYRDPKNWAEEIQMGIPGLSYSLTPHLDPNGLPSRRHYQLINAIAPLNLSPEGRDPILKELYEQSVVSSQIRAIKEQYKAQEITESEAYKALEKAKQKLYGGENVESSSFLAAPVLADERKGEVMTMVFLWNDKVGMYIDSYGNPGPDQPDHETQGDSYTYDFIKNEETGIYEDLQGEPAPFEIVAQSVDSQASLAKMIEEGQNIGEGEDFSKFKVSASVSKGKKRGTVSVKATPKFTPKTTKAPSIRVSQPRTISPYRSNGPVRVSTYQVKLPPQWKEANNIVKIK